MFFKTVDILSVLVYNYIGTAVDSNTLQLNIQSVLDRVQRASAGGQRVTVVAATKTVPASVINLAVELGITELGENRTNEFIAKRELVTGANWHFIGTLQSNKVKYVVGKTALIQSVSSVELLKKIDLAASKLGIVQPVLIEVNVAGEASKTGAPVSLASELLDTADGCRNVTLCGMMSMPPREASDGVYEQIYTLYQKLKTGRRAFDTLSVGMSGDFERAIAHGSNMVRIGSAIFGRRA